MKTHKSTIYQFFFFFYSINESILMAQSYISPKYIPLVPLENAAIDSC